VRKAWIIDRLVRDVVRGSQLSGFDFKGAGARQGTKARDGAVEVIVAVDVGGPVIVAVHVHGYRVVTT
jgi:hypothetical protein